MYNRLQIESHLQSISISSVPLVDAFWLALGSVLGLGLARRRLHPESLRVPHVFLEHSLELCPLLVLLLAVCIPLFFDLRRCLADQLSSKVDEPCSNLWKCVRKRSG